VCDHLLVLAASQVRVSGDVSDLLRTHHRLSGPRQGALPRGCDVIEERHTDRQSILLVHTDEPILDPAWTVSPVTLDDLVIAYMGRRTGPEPTGRPSMEVVR
jgi:ABC-2 type transport system ATP-binding protein